MFSLDELQNLPAWQGQSDLEELLPLSAILLDQVSDVIVAIDLQQRVLYWNRAATLLYGIPEAEAIAQPLTSLYEIHWADPTEYKDAYQSLYATGNWRGKNLHITRSGRSFWVESTVSVLKNAQEQAIGLIAVIRELEPGQPKAVGSAEDREQLASRSRTQAEQSWMQQTIGRITDGFFVMDRNWRILYANTLAQDMAEKTLDQLQGMHFDEVTRLEETIFAEKYQEAFDTNQPVHFEGFHTRRQRWFEVHAYPDQEGLSVFFRDISELKQAQEKRQRAEVALQESEAQFRTLIANLPGAAYRCQSAPLWRDVFLSAEIEAITGYSAAEILSWRDRTYIHLTHPDDMRITCQRAEAAIRQYQPYSLEYRIIHRNGSIRWVSDRGQGIYDSKGTLQWIDGFIYDITERKQAEAQLKASLKEKEVLLREIHHRVKNNLQVILSLLDLQSQQMCEQAVLEALQESKNRILSMALIHQELHQSDHLTQVDFKKYVSDLVAQFVETYAVHPENIEVQLDLSPIFLTLDTAIPCGLILNELLSNALKHGFPDQRQGVIWIQLQSLQPVSCSQGNLQFELIVGNNGVPISPEIELEQANTLGFQLIHSLVSQLEGQVELEVNEGTEFRVRFSEVLN